ncbi:MAG TPA: tRNA uridine-5-carboxymethylaminomethyl(34) synthesis GTPase MnmE [Casimicrobiaceae bacterium]|nr:tRNA uridine-5-carboxymethylaminomethyl(34) synthesis GTPase MnmE [Casimicrobiaceae bacterium]
MNAPRPLPPPETIAAIATPPGRGGVGVVRVSGNDLAALVEGIAGRALPPRVATRVTFRDAHGAPIDAGLALWFPRPNSYTGESVVEWHGHGGPAVMRLLLARCIELGARLAEPGEFTKRAFLNGKLDLAQAESVADVIAASTTAAVRAAARSLVGEFSAEVHALRNTLTDLRVYTEATLDFPEEDVEFLREGDVIARVAAIRERLAAILVRSRRGAILREGLTVVLVGAPNVGKSSLLNRLVGDEAAIVTPLPGTTRDTVERPIELAGIPLTIIDTAGLRETTDSVEALGIARTRVAIARADLALVLTDARGAGAPAAAPGTSAAASLSAEAGAARVAGELPAGLPRIIVHNKCDLAGVPARVLRGDDGSVQAWVSALTGEGIALLEAEMLRIAGAGHATEDVFLARERQVSALAEAAAHIAAAQGHASIAPPAIELFAEELRIAQEALSKVTGEFTADDLLGEIFSRFCIGK